MSNAELIEKNITLKRFDELTRQIVGMPVSHTWQGYSTAIFLEFGELKERAEPSERQLEKLQAISLKFGKLKECPPNYKGEATLMLEFDWRVEKTRSIEFGSLESNRKIQNGIKKFIGKTVAGINIEGRIPEIIIRLDSDKWIRSFTLYEGQPQWTLFLPDKSWICVNRGRLIREKS